MAHPPVVVAGTSVDVGTDEAGAVEAPEDEEPVSVEAVGRRTSRAGAAQGLNSFVAKSLAVAASQFSNTWLYCVVSSSQAFSSNTEGTLERPISMRRLPTTAAQVSVEDRELRKARVPNAARTEQVMATTTRVTIGWSNFGFFDREVLMG